MLNEEQLPASSPDTASWLCAPAVSVLEAIDQSDLGHFCVFCAFVCGCHMCGGHRMACGGWLSTSTVWVLGTELRLSGLVASAHPLSNLLGPEKILA